MWLQKRFWLSLLEKWEENAYSDPPFSLGLLIQDVRGWAILKMAVIQNVNGFAL